LSNSSGKYKNFSAYPVQEFSPEEEQRFLIEEELKKYKDDLGDDYKPLLDFARKLKLKYEAGFINICFDGEQLEPIEDSAFPQSLHYVLEALLYKKGLASNLRDVEKDVKVLGRILFDIKRALRDRELGAFLVELKLRPFNDRVNFVADKIPTMVNALLRVSTEYEGDDFKSLKKVDKTKIVCEVLNWGFTFIRVEPDKPTKPYDYYVLDEATCTLYSIESVTEPICGALVEKGLASRELKGEVEAAVKATRRSITWDQVDPWDKLNLRSGVLDLRTMRLTESQGYYFRYYPLPVSIAQEEIDEIRKGRYDIKDNEVYKAWREHFSNEDWEYFVNNLGTWLDYERSRLIVFIIGPTNIGKSTLLENLTSPIDPIVGRKDLKSITEDPFGLADLIGKQINVSTERVAITLRNIEIINKLVGEKDTLDVRVKYKPATVMKSLKTMAFAMNDPPIVHEYGGGTMAAFLNRLNIIFVRAPEGFKPIKGFTVDTKENFKFLLCCRALYDTEGREIKRRDEEYKLNFLMEATNTALQFLKSEWIIVDPSAKVKGATLYNAYVAYCREKGVTPMSRNEFYSVVESKFSRIPENKTPDRAVWFKGLMLDPRKMSEVERD
jgi:hypothetical protein